MTQRPPLTIHPPELPTGTPSQVRFIAWKPKYLVLGLGQVSDQSLPLLQQHRLPRSSKLSKPSQEQRMWLTCAGRFGSAAQWALGKTSRLSSVSLLPTGSAQIWKDRTCEEAPEAAAVRSVFQPPISKFFSALYNRRNLEMHKPGYRSYFPNLCSQSSQDQRTLYKLRYLWRFYLLFLCNVMLSIAQSFQKGTLRIEGRAEMRQAGKEMHLMQSSAPKSCLESAWTLGRFTQLHTYFSRDFRM